MTLLIKSIKFVVKERNYYMSDLKEDKLKAVNLKNLTLKELTLKELTLKGLTLKKPILKKLILKRLFLMVIVQWDYQSCIKVINFYQEVLH